MAKAGRKSKYNAQYAKTLNKQAENPAVIMGRNGRISDKAVGELFGVDAKVIKRWKTPVPGRESEYKPAFAKAFNKCQQAIDSGNIKRSMIEKAEGFIQVKRVYEQRIPATKEQIEFSKNRRQLGKDELINTAKDLLALDLDPDAPIEQLQDQVLDVVYKLCKPKKFLIKEEKTTQAGDVAAAKLVLNNIQKHEPEDEQWNTADKAEQTHKIDGFSQFLQEIGSAGTGLPIKE